MTGRLLYAAAHLVAALCLLLLLGAALGVVALGIFRPPPYVEWAGLGWWGLPADIVLAVGTVLWGVLAVSSVVWLVRCFGRIAHALAGPE
ncbi:MAG TPA: hypothetical protein PLP66_14495 [Phycisphaerae bacterium]|nr:hypothetical protein [Phycisphaerae bacterium]HPM25114.1 hypothetical protein [Phycisphaerae bacterium]